MTTHKELHDLLKRNGKPVPSRKLANNTYAIRDWPHSGDIHIRFHETNIITFGIDGTITLNSGGWLTQVTKERMNRFLPEPLQVYSVKGRWKVRVSAYDNAPGAYFTDGIHLAPVHRPGSTDRKVWVVANGLSPTELCRQDAHNQRVEKLIDGYMRWLTLERYDVIFQRSDENSGCGMCVRTDVGSLVGDSFEDKQHLIEHLIDKDVPFGVFHVACDHGYGGGDGIRRAAHFDIAKRDLRKYLRQQLYVGPVAIKGGKRPAHTQPWSMTAQLKRSKSA